MYSILSLLTRKGSQGFSELLPVNCKALVCYETLSIHGVKNNCGGVASAVVLVIPTATRAAVISPASAVIVAVIAAASTIITATILSSPIIGGFASTT